jgi:hypothetical protein
MVEPNQVELEPQQYDLLEAEAPTQPDANVLTYDEMADSSSESSRGTLEVSFTSSNSEKQFT